MRLVPFDQGVFKNQRFKLTAGNDHVEIRNFLNHGGDLGEMIPMEVARDAVFQFFRLADVDYFRMFVQHNVNARQKRQAVRLFSQRFQVGIQLSSPCFAPNAHHMVMVATTMMPPMRANMPGFSPSKSMTHTGFSSGSSPPSRQQASGGQYSEDFT